MDLPDDLVSRLGALLVKLDAHYDVLVESVEAQRQSNDQHAVIHADLRESIAELREFNRAQRLTNDRLETLITRVFRGEANGRDA